MLLVLQLLFLAIVGGAQRFGCPIGKTLTDAGTCTFTTGGLHMTCTTHTWPDAQSACIKSGYRLAAITEQNLLLAQAMLLHCAYQGQYDGAAFIGSENGMVGEPCLVFGWNRTVAVQSGGECGGGGLGLQVLCQEIPSVTDTTTTTTTTTLTSGVSTTTTRTTLRTQATMPWEDLIVEKRNVNVSDDNNGKCGDPCDKNYCGCAQTGCNCCSDACPTTAKGLHLIPALNQSDYSEADAHCARFGWRLADYTSGMTSLLSSYLLPSCSTSGALSVGLWVRSINGVSGFACASVDFDLSLAQGQRFVLGHTEQYCLLAGASRLPQFERFVLCQEQRGPAVTGYGPAVQWTTTVTGTSVSTSTVVVPSSTTTVTSTVACRHHRVAPFRRPRWIATVG
jgi:hypothetical protein